MTSCDRCADLHEWAAGDDRQAAVCPARVVDRAAASIRPTHNRRHIRRIAEDVTLWRPYVIAMVQGICTHPAQATWTTDEIEEAIASRIRVKAYDSVLAEPHRPRRAA